MLSVGKNFFLPQEKSKQKKKEIKLDVMALEAVACSQQEGITELQFL